MLPFLILQNPLIQMKTMLTRLVVFMVLAKPKHRKTNVIFVGETTASTDVTVTQVNILPQTFQEEVSNSVSLAAPKAAPPGPDCKMMGSL
jgi:hypothetical protein